MLFLKALNHSKPPDFLLVKSGDYVAIKRVEELTSSLNQNNHWIGQVINCIGGARDPKAWTLFQVINIDTGEISMINADMVEMILKTSSKSK